jgi:hypothetical protein
VVVVERPLVQEVVMKIEGVEGEVILEKIPLEVVVILG